MAIPVPRGMCHVCLMPCGRNRYCPEHRKLKYHNRKAEVDGLIFDSKKEARRYGELKLLQQRGEIRELRRQVSYDLEVNRVLVCRYVADFVYQEKVGGDWREVTEDAKGVRTEAYKLKKKLMLAVHGVEIREV